jgi:hypothetical protein
MDSASETTATNPPADRTDLPIDEAAWDTLQLERATAILGDFDISLGESFSDPASRAIFARRERTEALHTYRLQDVTLDASLMLLLKGRARIPETRYLVTDDEYAAALVKPLPAVPLDPTEHYVIGCNRVWHNYYHWLIQAVPTIDWALRQRGQHKVTLVLPPLLPWQQETLALLGYQDVPRLTLGISDTYLLPDVEYTEFLGARMPEIVSHAAVATFRHLDAAVPWTRGWADEIYVARTDTQNRVAVNEAELIDLLDRQGVRIVIPGSLSVAEQIATFRAARLVIGPHGAGMSNIVFCQPGSFVYEMVLRNYPNPCFNLLAQSVGLNYAADLFDSDGVGGLHQQTWRIDIDLVATRLDAIRARTAATPRAESAMVFLKRTQTEQPDEMTLPIPVSPSRAVAKIPQLPAPKPEQPRGLLARLIRPCSRGGDR